MRSPPYHHLEPPPLGLKLLDPPGEPGAEIGMRLALEPPTDLGELAFELADDPLYALLGARHIVAHPAPFAAPSERGRRDGSGRMPADVSQKPNDRPSQRLGTRSDSPSTRPPSPSSIGGAGAGRKEMGRFSLGRGRERASTRFRCRLLQLEEASKSGLGL